MARHGEPLPPRTNGGGNGKVPPREDIAAIYDYENPDGTLFLQVVRTISGNPRFRQRRKAGAASGHGASKTSQATTAVLYRLPGLRASGHETVWITEGEKDADRLHERTADRDNRTSAGAGKWRDEYAAEFRDKHVVVLARQRPSRPGPRRPYVARHLIGVAASVKVLLLPGLPPKGDVSDWLDAGNTIEELQRLAREAPEYEAPTDPPPPPPIDGDDDGDGRLAEEYGDDGLITENSVALAFARQHRESLRYCHHAGAWYQWTGHYWRREETKLAYSWARKLARQIAKDTNNFKARLEAGKASFSGGIERMAQTDRAFAVTSKIWDQDVWLLSTPGGTVDLRTGQLRPPRQQDHITKQTAVAPAETADCPMWFKFLEQATQGDEALVTFLQRWFGYCLTGETREEALVFCYGPGGNGKGVLMHTVFNIMHDYAKKTAMDTFVVGRGDKHTTDIAMLVGARLVVTTETEEGQAWAEAKVKDLTGRDPITARFMRRDNFIFTPQFKLTVSGNHKPGLKTVDDAIKRRVMMFPFLHKPVEPDKTLSDRLEREWPQILRWMILGGIEWQRVGLCPPPVVLETTKDYFDAQDYFGRWLEECCKLHLTLETKPSELLRSFQDWCRDNGEEASDNRRLRGLIEKTPGLRYVKTGGNRSVRGIGLNPPVNDWRRGPTGGDQW